MKNMKRAKERAVKVMKHNVVSRQAWSAVLNALSALGMARVSIVPIENQEDFYGVKVRSFLIIIFLIMGVASIALLVWNMFSCRKYRKDYYYYVESKKISDALLTAVKRTSFAKTNSILRSTYGTVPKWHPIDYCKNVLVYDVHEHLRDICIKLKEVVVDLAPEEFDDDMVTVDIAFEYPSDKEFILNRKNEIKSKSAETHSSSDAKNDDLECNLDLKLKKLSEKENSALERWKVITSGDRTSSRVNLHSYLSEKDSFYNYLQENGYFFCNDKMELVKDNHYIWSSKDKEYDRNGSIAGVVIELKNDNPEKVFVRVFLTITTYGRKFVEKTDLLDEKTFKKLFKETVINSFKTIIETELAQMFIRHGINNYFIDRHSGKICD